MDRSLPRRDKMQSATLPRLQPILEIDGGEASWHCPTTVREPMSIYFRIARRPKAQRLPLQLTERRQVAGGSRTRLHQSRNGV